MDVETALSKNRSILKMKLNTMCGQNFRVSVITDVAADDPKVDAIQDLRDASTLLAPLAINADLDLESAAEDDTIDREINVSFVVR